MKSTVMQMVDQITQTFERDRLLKELDAVYENIEKISIPMLNILPKDFDKDPTTTAIVKAGIADSKMYKNMHPRLALLEICRRLLKDKVMFRKTYEARFNSTIVKDTMNLAGVNMIYYLSIVREFEKFVRAYCLHQMRSSAEAQGYDYINKSDSSVLEEYKSHATRAKYVSIVRACSYKLSDMGRALREYEHTELKHVTETNMTDSKHGDAFEIGFVPYWINPVFLTLSIWEEIVEFWYELGEEEIKRFGLEVEYLQRLKDDPNLPSDVRKEYEDQITWHVNAIKGRRARLEQIRGSIQNDY